MKTSTKWLLGILIGVIIIGVGVFIWQKLSKPLSNNSKESNNKTTEEAISISGKTVKVEVINGEKFCEDKNYPQIGYQKILKAVFTDKTEKILFSTTRNTGNNDCLFSYGLRDVSLSPNEKYVFFSKTGWESAKPYMLNIGTGKYVFGDDTEIKDIYIISETKWSPNNQDFFLTSDVNEMGGVGKKAIYTSEYNNADKIQKIWTAKNYLLETIKSIKFVGDDKLMIDIEEKDAESGLVKSIKYQYNYQNNQLTPL